MDLNFSVLGPSSEGEMSFDLVASAIESPRSLSGLSGALDASGGGFWLVKYSFDLFTPAHHKYWTMVARFLAGGVNGIRIPFVTDRTGPFPLRDLWLNPPTVSAALVGAHALNAGTATLQVYGTDAQPLVGGETFEIDHGSSGSNKDVRAYTITTIDSTTHDTPSAGHTQYAVGIKPTLRQAAADGKTVTFFRPRCLMRLVPGQSTAWAVSGYWSSKPSLSFIEKFPK